MITEDNKGLLPFGATYNVEWGDRRFLKKPFRIMQYYYPIAEIQEEVFKRTSMLAKYTLGEKGASQFDKGTLSKDEDVAFDMLCQQAADEVARVMMPFLPVTQRAYIYNQGFVTTGDVKAGGYAKDANGKLYMAVTDTNCSEIGTDKFEELEADVSNSVHFIIKKGIDVYDNSVSLCDHSVMEMIVGYILKEWVMMALPERAEQYAAMYERERENLRYNLNMLIKPVRCGHPF